MDGLIRRNLVDNVVVYSHVIVENDERRMKQSLFRIYREMKNGIIERKLNGFIHQARETIL